MDYEQDMKEAVMEKAFLFGLCLLGIEATEPEQVLQLYKLSPDQEAGRGLLFLEMPVFYGNMAKVRIIEPDTGKAHNFIVPIESLN